MKNYYSKVREFVFQATSTRNKMCPERVPSVYWTDFVNNFRYVFELKPTELRRIRFHTYHLTSDNYLTYYFATDEYKKLLEDGYCYFSKGFDLVFLDEGDFGIGADTIQGRISHDLLRYLGVYCDIKESGVTAGNSHKIVMELGGGYGGLARVLLKQLPLSSYIICDLEETLFFSAINLANYFGDDRVHLIDSMMVQDNLQPGHIYIVPQSRMQLIENLYFDFVISQQSLQEMSHEQVNFYLSWFSSRADYFYSCNIDSHGALALRKDLVTNLSQILLDKFGQSFWSGNAPAANCRFGDNHLPRAIYKCSKL